MWQLLLEINIRSLQHCKVLDKGVHNGNYKKGKKIKIMTIIWSYEEFCKNKAPGQRKRFK